MRKLYRPYLDESLSSWLQRVSFYQLSSAYQDLVSSLSKNHDLDYGLNDEQMKHIGSTHQLTPSLVKKIASPPSSWVIRDVSARGAYCPKCWVEDVRAGRTPYWRKSWSNVWNTFCFHHAMFLEDGERMIHSFIPDAALCFDNNMGSPSIALNVDNSDQLPMWRRKIRTSDAARVQRTIEVLHRFSDLRLLKLKLSITPNEFLDMLRDLICLVARFHPQNSYSYGSLVRTQNSIVTQREFAINCPVNVNRLALLNMSFDLMNCNIRRCGLIELGRLCGIAPIRDPYSGKPIPNGLDAIKHYWRFICTSSSEDLMSLLYRDSKYFAFENHFKPNDLSPDNIPFFEWLGERRGRWAPSLREIFNFPLEIS